MPGCFHLSVALMACGVVGLLSYRQVIELERNRDGNTLSKVTSVTIRCCSEPMRPAVDHPRAKSILMQLHTFTEHGTAALYNTPHSLLASCVPALAVQYASTPPTNPLNAIRTRQEIPAINRLHASSACR